MSIPTIRYTEMKWDLPGFAEKIRPADRVELLLSNGCDIQETLEYSVRLSDECFVAETPEDGVLCLFGVGPAQEPAVGIPWMVGTDAMLKHPKGLIQGGRWATERWLEKYPTLVNFVHAANAVSIAWLQHIGFSLGQLVPNYGVGQAPFYQFYRHRNDPR